LIKKYGLTTYTEVEKGIQDFWKQVLINSDYFTINDKDKQILNFLKEIKLIESVDKVSFTIEFVFGTNEYFTNTSLTKTYHYEVKDQELHRIEASKIEWTAEDKKPNKKITTKKIKSKIELMFRR
jgi:nucleosome assembly protein 1-like 1